MIQKERKEFVSVSDEQDRNYWASRLGVTAEVLKSAIRAIHQTELSKVQAYLKRSRLNSHTMVK